jgi:ESCRT-II complex subunit VPS25
VQETRIKQLELWKELILKYHMQHNLHSMTLAEFQYFENREIDRKLNRESILVVINHLIASGNGEWEDASQSRVRILWRTPEALAADIYQWVGVGNT